MVSFLYRFVISVLGLAPMSFAIFVTGANKCSSAQAIILQNTSIDISDNLIKILNISIGFFVALFICATACFLLNLLINTIRRTGNSLLISKTEIESVTQQSSTLLPYFLSYVMPLFLGESIEMEFWAFCFVAIIIASFFTTGISNNPLINILGYKFYTIQMKSGVTQLYISKERPQAIINGFNAIIYDENTIIQGRKK